MCDLALEESKMLGASMPSVHSDTDYILGSKIAQIPRAWLFQNNVGQRFPMGPGGRQ